VAPKGHNPALVILFIDIHDTQAWHFEYRMNNHNKNFTFSAVFSCSKFFLTGYCRNDLKVPSLTLLEIHS